MEENLDEFIFLAGMGAKKNSVFFGNRAFEWPVIHRVHLLA